jgi:hypothetical protein
VVEHDECTRHACDDLWYRLRLTPCVVKPLGS